MAELQDEIAQLLREHQLKTGKLLTIGTVESATGGKIGDRITNVPGSSDYYKGSIVAYSNKVKSSIVGVKAATLKKHGAVSPQAAMKMAEGGRKLLKVDICVADTGIAGPTGATRGKPIGLFYISLSTKHTTFAQEYRFHGTRDDNKHKAAEVTLQILKDFLTQYNSGKLVGRLDEKHVVTCFLEHADKILILRRSSKVGTYQRKWAGISGYMEKEELEQAFAEISEETELYKNDLKLIKKGEPLEIIDKGLNRKWIVHPFLFHVKAPGKIRIDWEHTDIRWIKPSQLGKYETVPGLKKALSQVLK
jgi:PncC family amidohydrolase